MWDSNITLEPICSFLGFSCLLCTKQKARTSHWQSSCRYWTNSSKAAHYTPVGTLYLCERVWSYVIKRRKKWLIGKLQWLLILLCPFDCLSCLQSCRIGIYLAINLLQNGFSSPLLGRIFHWGYCSVKLMKHRFPFAQMLAFPCINSSWLEVKIRLRNKRVFLLSERNNCSFSEGHST